MGNFAEYIKTNTESYKSIPFWSWNDALDPKELKRQIRDMKRLNMGGFFMHARSGLETEYQSEEWYNCIRECVDEVKELEMQAWAYDENGWPSGFAGGKLLEDERNHAHFLEYKVLPEFDTEAFAVYVLENNTLRRVFSPESGANEYHTVYRGTDTSYVDTMDASVTREFIKQTHEQYKKECGDDFGKAMPGFFTDEPQYFRYKTVWSDTLPIEFEKKYGYDVMSALPALFIDFDGAKEFRYDYHYICHELFINNFIKQIYDWCEANGAAITGHAVEEKMLFGQMWCCGGVMPFYEYMTIPGVDYLTKGIGNDISSKQVGSVAAQLGKKKVLSEMFACCGWDVTPVELKRVAEHQYYGGVNLMCQHLYPYSMRGQRKRDYPAFYSEHQSWQEAMGDFNLYFARLGAALSCGDEYANVLVIHPIHSAYLDYMRERDLESIKELELGFSALTETLAKGLVPFHYGDEWLMRKYAHVEGSVIHIGNCAYDTVILPPMYTLDASTAELLKQFISAGGKICICGEKPTRIDGRIADLSFIIENTTIDEIMAQNDITITTASTNADFRVMQRNTEFGKLFYVLNESKERISDVTVKFNCGEDFSRIDLLTMEQTKIDKNAYVTDFEGAESMIFIEEQAKDTQPCSNEPLLCADVKVTQIDDNALTLDYARLSYDGVEYTEPRPIVRIKDNLLAERYQGKLFLKFEFDVASIPDNINIVCEKLNSCSVRVNGHNVSFNGDYMVDRSFLSSNITSVIKPGRNAIVLEIDYYQRDYVYYVLYGGVSESLRNCLNFDTEIEAIYLFGDFKVETESDKFNEVPYRYYVYGGSYVISRTGDDIDTSDLVKNGYPFFSGKLTLEAKRISGNILTLSGEYSTARVYVDDQPVKYLLFDNKCDISPYIKNGGETIKVEVWQSRRNLFGPHHHIDHNTVTVPPTFSFEKQWNGDKCDAYVDTYTLKKFGVKL